MMLIREYILSCLLKIHSPLSCCTLTQYSSDMMFLSIIMHGISSCEDDVSFDLHFEHTSMELFESLRLGSIILMCLFLMDSGPGV
jgi:hypothetical protein